MRVMEIDVNRVHDVLSGKLRGRRVGNSFAQVCLIAGEIHVGDADRIFVITGPHSISWSIHFTGDVLYRLGIKPVSKKGNILTCEYEGRYIELIFHREYDSGLFRGYRNTPLYSLVGQ